MALPTFNVPKYNVTLPSNGKTVSIRPFLVKEQKQLLMAINGTLAEQATAVIEIVRACTFGAVDPDKLPAFDLEYLFLQIRSRSVGENVDLVLTCSCGEQTNTVLDITTVEVKRTANHTNKIDLDGNLMLVMRYPRLAEIDLFQQRGGADATIELIASSIESIWEGDTMFASTDYSKEELIQFVESLSPAAFDKIETFFASMPVLSHEVNWTCKKCDTPNVVVMQGIESFFG